MSFNVAMLEAMQDEGLDLGACIRVLRAGEVKKDPTAAERQARYRERNKITRDVTRDDVTERVSFDKKEPQTPKKLNPSHVCETRVKGRWHRLPEDWSPTRQIPQPLQAKVDQWPPGTLADELAAFRRWAANAEDKNGKGRKLDWDQAWRNWIGRRHDERYSRPNTVGRHQPSDGLSATTRAALSVFGASH